jgi:hypothetical protein
MKIVFEASTEAEGKMMQEILAKNNILSELNVSSTLSNLKSRLGGAAFPNEQWKLVVRDEDETQAKDLLP